MGNCSVLPTPLKNTGMLCFVIPQLKMSPTPAAPWAPGGLGIYHLTIAAQPHVCAHAHKHTHTHTRTHVHTHIVFYEQTVSSWRCFSCMYLCNVILPSLLHLKAVLRVAGGVVTKSTPDIILPNSHLHQKETFNSIRRKRWKEKQRGNPSWVKSLDSCE